MEGLIFGVLRYIGVYYKRYGFFSRFGLMKTDQPMSLKTGTVFNETARVYKRIFALKLMDHFRFLGNCPTTPPLSHRFALSEK